MRFPDESGDQSLARTRRHDRHRASRSCNEHDPRGIDVKRLLWIVQSPGLEVFSRKTATMDDSRGPAL
jgi:hypothetical protein